jgi:hypothetical protein
MKVKVDWDLDGISHEEAGVPEVVELPQEFGQAITEYLSDTYDWCHLGWNVEAGGREDRSLIKVYIISVWSDEEGELLFDASLTKEGAQCSAKALLLKYASRFFATEQGALQAIEGGRFGYDIHEVTVNNDLTEKA